MKYYIVANSRDGMEIQSFINKEEAEQFCATFLERHRTNKGCIELVVHGTELEPAVVDVVKAIEFKQERPNDR